ncbi:unnamed protein product [Tenebrio molitor]|nr:unnamed protein product [Tenebrio molitor]
MLVSCMSLFTKHNYRAKKLNNLTLKCSTQREQGLYIQTLHYSNPERIFKCI